MRKFVALAMVVVPLLLGQAQTGCVIQRQKEFVPQHKTVALASKSGTSDAAQFVLFQTALRVNTDGAPNSYHPQDPKGQTKAINNIANAISVRRNGKAVSYQEMIHVFEEFRDHNWTVPTGYQLTWENVLAARTEAGRQVPCVFTSGDYKGYFGSLTALQNNLSGAAAGECGEANQLDERYVPALVMAGGNNPLKTFGVSIGDLLIAINPANGVVQAAVVGDAGPPENLGEGSVALNMALLKETRQPTSYSDAKALDTGQQAIIVAIIPKSAKYKLERPYSESNITARVTEWVTAHGYETLDSFSGTVEACAAKIAH